MTKNTLSTWFKNEEKLLFTCTRTNAKRQKHLAFVNAWWETSFQTLFTNYDLKDIYNAEKFGLFYQCLPNKTYRQKSEKCSRGTLSKIQGAVANAIGDKRSDFGEFKTHGA